MLTATKMICSESGNIKEIEVVRLGPDMFIAKDSIGNSIAMDCVVALKGIEAVAKHRSQDLLTYIMRLQKAYEPEEEPAVKLPEAVEEKVEPVVEKKEEPNVTSV